MLFNNFEPYEIPQTGEVSMEGLKKAFPEFFDEENPQPVKIHAQEYMFKRVKQVRDKDKVPLGVVRKAPEPTGHKAVANIIIDGKQVNLQYSEAMPTIGAFNKSFPPNANRITLKHDFSIRSGQTDLLFFLYYGMGVVSNSYKPSRMPMYEFYKPQAKAADRISKWKKAQELEALVFSTLTYDKVKMVMAGLNLDLLKTEEENRTRLVDKVRTGGPLFQKTFYELVEVKPNADNASKEDVSEAVNRLIAEGKIKQEDGAWFSMSKVKIGEWNKTAFYDTKQSDEAESVLALIEHLKVNEILFNKINS